MAGVSAMFSNSIASSHGAPRGPAPVLGLPLFGGGGRQPAEGNQVVIPTWVVICQHRTGSCYRGRREEFPDQVPPELANLITQHEWMARVVPEVTECLDRFVDPKYYNYLHVLLTIFFALQVSHHPARTFVHWAARIQKHPDVTLPLSLSLSARRCSSLLRPVGLLRS